MSVESKEQPRREAVGTMPSWVSFNCPCCGKPKLAEDKVCIECLGNIRTDYYNPVT